MAFVERLAGSENPHEKALGARGGILIAQLKTIKGSEDEIEAKRSR
jgi:hypothetical protein